MTAAVPHTHFVRRPINSHQERTYDTSCRTVRYSSNSRTCVMLLPYPVLHRDTYVCRADRATSLQHEIYRTKQLEQLAEQKEVVPQTARRKGASHWRDNYKYERRKA